MCLAIPGQVETIFQAEGLKMAKVNFGGIRKDVCVQYIDELQNGDYVLVHVGFAISLINEEEAARTLKALEENGGVAEELA